MLQCIRNYKYYLKQGNFHKKLEKNRRAFIEKNAVWKSSNNNLDFIESDFLSTIYDFRKLDMHAEEREKGKKIKD